MLSSDINWLVLDLMSSLVPAILKVVCLCEKISSWDSAS